MTLNNRLEQKATYITDQKLIYDTSIYEYDLRQANISILYAYDKISESLYRQLQATPKEIRETYIGNMERLEKDQNHTKISETYQIINKIGIPLEKQMLIDSNQILQSQIIRVANDAVYIKSDFPLNYTSFDLNHNQKLVTFISKNQFNSVITFNNRVSIFIGINQNDTFTVDVIGIANDQVPLCQEFISNLCMILYYLERSGLKTALYQFSQLYEDYINLRLPIDAYREMHPDPGFRLAGYTKVRLKLGPQFLPDTLEMKQKIDISYNLNLLRELYSYMIKNTN